MRSQILRAPSLIVLKAAFTGMGQVQLLCMRRSAALLITVDGTLLHTDIAKFPT